VDPNGNKRQLKLKLGRTDRNRLCRMWVAGIACGSAGALDMKKLRREGRVEWAEKSPGVAFDLG
jgi:hypothetical protein